MRKLTIVLMAACLPLAASLMPSLAGAVGRATGRPMAMTPAAAVFRP